MGKNDTESTDVQEASGNETATAEQKPPEVKPEKKKKKKESKPFDPLSDDPVVFKKIDFESALTAEEKAARKAAKLAAKKGKKPKKEKPPPEEEPPEPPAEPPIKKKKVKPEAEPSKDVKPPEEKKKEKKDKPTPPAEGASKEGKEKKGKKAERKESEPSEKGVQEGKVKKKGKEKQEKPKTDVTKQSEIEVGKKGKKGKGKKDKSKESVDESVKDKKEKEKETGVETEPDVEKKGKKAKGKGKGKGKAKKSLEPESSKLDVQASISAFLEHYESQQLNEDEWTWESYTPSEESTKVEEKVKKGKEKGKGKGKKKTKEMEKKEGEEAETAKPKGKKGKGKDKKGKKAAKEEVVAPKPVVEVAQPAFDIMEEINRMKALADAQALGVTEEVEEASMAPSKKSKKSKKGDKKEEGKSKPKKVKVSKKKLTKKELAELIEQQRIQAEFEAKAAEEAEKMRLLEEKRAGIAKEKQEASEQILRTEQLNNSLNLIKTVQAKNAQKALRDKERREWEEYLKCDGLPDPYVCSQLSTYLHLWDKVIKNMTIDEVAAKSVETLKMLDILTSLIDDPVGAKPSQVENWHWIRHLFREYQQKMLDNTTYRLLRDVRKRLNRLDLSTAEFRRKEESFALFLWLLIKLPTRRPNPRAPPPPRIKVDVPEMGMSILFPVSFQCQNQTIRAMYLKYDHLSDLCANYQKPPTPEIYEQDVNKAAQEEWYSKLYYKYLNRKKPIEENSSEQEIVVDRTAGIIPTVPYQKLEPTASTYCIDEEDQLYLQVRESLFTKAEDSVVNLRKYIVLGGIFSINVFYQPPQPQGIVSFDVTVSRLEIPKCLSTVPMCIKYEPIISEEEEETEEDIQRQQEELDKLLLVDVRLPEHIMWFDVPLVCQWDDNEQVWTTKEVYDLKHVKEENRFTFRTGRLDCFAMAMYKFSNMPYHSWELKPEGDGTISFTIVAAIIVIEFTIKEDLICVSQLDNTPNNALKKIVGVYFTLPKLIRTLRETGVDIFPEFDAFCYTEGTCEKHWPIEKHAYYNMAQLCVCYNFVWSRWNKTAGRRRIVLQMREYRPGRLTYPPYAMLLITPLKTAYIDCTEQSEEFSEEYVQGMKFYSDLYNLMKGTTTSIATKAIVQNAPYGTVGIVAKLLIATRVMSFC